jgi:hypothetical protein
VIKYYVVKQLNYSLQNYLIMNIVYSAIFPLVGNLSFQCQHEKTQPILIECSDEFQRRVTLERKKAKRALLK